MFFSVLIANYNNSRFLSTAIESVLNQTWPHWEIILVDDGSTDNFQEVICKYLIDKRIRVFSNAVNKGCGYTKRRCVELATGEIAAFLDPDDKLSPEALETMIHAHQCNSQHSVIHSTHWVCDESLNPIRVAEYVKALPNNTPYLVLNDGRIHHFASFKIALYRQTAGIDASLSKAVDQDLYYKMEETGSILFIDKPLYYYRIHNGSISNCGKELETTLIHYQLAKTACRRRIALLKTMIPSPAQKSKIRQYRTRYYKLDIYYASRSRKWPLLIISLAKYPFVGGLSNILSYVKKIPAEGTSLFRKTFVSNYQIR